MDVSSDTIFKCVPRACCKTAMLCLCSDVGCLLRDMQFLGRLSLGVLAREYIYDWRSNKIASNGVDVKE